jgi:hypothetical protein
MEEQDEWKSYRETRKVRKERVKFQKENINLTTKIKKSKKVYKRSKQERECETELNEYFG